MCPDTTPDKKTTATPKGAKRDTGYPMLPRLRDDALAVLRDLGPALERAMPLKTKHKEDLPKAVRELSEQLTSERGGLSGKYLQSPRTLAAYTHYFLPWNVYRQARLFAGLWLRLRDGARILDLGSGPLTAAMALWAARPDLRNKDITFVCVDRTAKALYLGQELFKAIGGTWTLELRNEPLEQALKTSDAPYDMILFCNVLNELRWAGSEPMETGVARLAGLAVKKLHPKRQPHLLAVEPGTRLGGRLVAFMRKAAQELGLTVLSPCTHQAPCPMLDRRANSWCHFRCLPEGVPDWLKELSNKAGLPKETLALSFAHLSHVTAKQQDTARVLSNPFRLQDQGTSGSYACSGRGMLLIEEQGRPSLQQGDMCDYELPKGSKRDPKSGALMARLPQSAPPPPRPQKPGSGAPEQRPQRPGSAPAKKGRMAKGKTTRDNNAKGRPAPAGKKGRKPSGER